MLPNPGLYLHLPWCIKKCPYCDFNSHPLKGEPGSEQPYVEYISALRRDIGEQLSHSPQTRFKTVFIGGGTPSLCPPHLLGETLSDVPLHNHAEITMEANPGASEYFEFAQYKDAGINRLSIGAQSFDASQLATLGRIHSPQQVETAFDKARKAGLSNINLDIMWGLPNQSVESAMADLAQALALDPEHLSWYQLTIEPKTEFAKRPPQLPVDNTLADIETAGLELLTKHGYTRYEVSAYAKSPELECQHNLNYWRFGDYAGAGAGAHGKWSTTVEPDESCKDGIQLSVERHAKPGSPRLYQNNPTDTKHTRIEPSELPAEYMLNALRLVEGTTFDAFSEATHLDWNVVAPTWQKLVSMELVREDRCATTKLGMRYLDSVVAEFI